MKSITPATRASLLAAACFLAASPGQALAASGPTPTPVGPTLSDCTTLAGTNRLVTVTECAFSGGKGAISSGGTYGISVSGAKGAREVTAFYVSTNNPSPGADLKNPVHHPFTSRSGWDAGFWSPADWDEYMADAYGKFGDLFGSDLGVYGYWLDLDLGSSNPLKIDTAISAGSLTFGWYGGAPSSHFVAVNGTTVVSQSFTSPVPEPSTYAMALAGLGVLGLWARRQQRRGASRAHAPAA